MIDLYCERIEAGLLAEPINALTNAAFFIAAWAAWSLARSSHRLSPGIWVLIALSITIGIGSALFHTFATGWARALDEVPILVFQLCYLWLYAGRIINLQTVISAAAIGAYLVVALLARQFPQVLNGSLVYAPALMLMLGLGLYHFFRHKTERLLLLMTTGIFVVAFGFRSVDEAVCAHFPIGTHFLWHVLIAVVLYLSIRALILNWPMRTSSRKLLNY